MSKIDYKQAIQVTHQNIAQIMALPCIWKCNKAYNGSYLYEIRTRNAAYTVREGDWIVELEEDNWTTYNKKDWEEIR